MTDDTSDQPSEGMTDGVSDRLREGKGDQLATANRDPATTAATLERWLSQVAGLEDVRVSNLAIPGSTGWSNETILFDATWRESGELADHELVARIAPTGYTVFPGRTFATQYQVMRALADEGSVEGAQALGGQAGQEHASELRGEHLLVAQYGAHALVAGDRPEAGTVHEAEQIPVTGGERRRRLRCAR